MTSRMFLGGTLYPDAPSADLAIDSAEFCATSGVFFSSFAIGAGDCGLLTADRAAFFTNGAAFVEAELDSAVADVNGAAAISMPAS